MNFAHVDNFGEIKFWGSCPVTNLEQNPAPANLTSVECPDVVNGYRAWIYDFNNETWSCDNEVWCKLNGEWVSE